MYKYANDQISKGKDDAEKASKNSKCNSPAVV